MASMWKKAQSQVYLVSWVVTRFELMSIEKLANGKLYLLTSKLFYLIDISIPN